MLALSQASHTTPAKPMARPNAREAVSLSFSHSHAISAPNSGVVALNIDDSPPVIASTARPKQTNGTAELVMPTSRIGFQCTRRAPSWPRQASSGSRNAAAPATRTKASATGPNSAAPMRMNKNDAPQIAASVTSSARRQPSCGCFQRLRVLLPVRFERQQRLLAMQAAGVAGERAVMAEHAVAGDDDAHRIAAYRRTHGAHGLRRTDASAIRR